MTKEKKFWNDAPHRTVSHASEFNEILKMIPNDKKIKILDVGGGQGNFEIILENMGYTNLTNFDIAKSALDIAEKRLKYTKMVEGDITRDGLPFKDKSFDLVMLIEVLEHVDNPYFAIKECMRVSKEVILTVPNGFWSQITPIKKVGTAPNYFAPTERVFVEGLKNLGANIVEWKYFFVSTTGDVWKSKENKLIKVLNNLRRLKPNLLASTFIVKIK